MQSYVEMAQKWVIAFDISKIGQVSEKLQHIIRFLCRKKGIPERVSNMAFF